MNRSSTQAEATTSTDAATTLLRHVQVIDPDFGWWQGQYQLKHAAVTLDGAKVDADKVTTPQLKLMEVTPNLKDWRKKFVQLNSEYQKVVANYTQKFPVAGLRMVPATRVRDLLYELIGRNDAGIPLYDVDRYVQRTGKSEQSIAYRLSNLADEFCANWYDLRNEMERSVDASVWDAVGKRIPGAAQIRKHYHLSVARIELNLGQDAVESARRGITRVDDLAEYAEYINQAMHRQIDQAITTLVAEPRRALAEAIEGLNELIVRDGNVTDRSFNGVRNAISQLRMFDFAANSSLLRQINDLEQRLSTADPGSMTAESARADGFIALITAVREGAESATQIEHDISTFGQAARAFDFGGN